MKQILLAALLIVVPVSVFSATELWLSSGQKPPAGAGTSTPLGDLTEYQAIVSDTRTLVDAGKLSAAEHHATDFETKWDNAESSLRPKAPAAWGNVDAAADRVFAALRSPSPDAKTVKTRLTALSDRLSHPSDGGSKGGVQQVAGIAVTDANGHAIPCETLLGKLRSALANGAIGDADLAQAKSLQSRATERCNADDDVHSDQLSARALALSSQ